MGQLIKELDKIPFLSDKLIVELNDVMSGNEKIIHFHYNNIRYEMTLSDYLTLLSGVIVAKKSLDRIKK